MLLSVFLRWQVPIALFFGLTWCVGRTKSVEAAGWPPESAEVAAAYIWAVSACVYLIAGLGCVFADTSDMSEDRLQGRASMPHPERYGTAMAVATANLLCVSLPLMVAWGLLARARGCPFGGELPPFFEAVVLYPVVFSTTEEFFFYLAHRALHASDTLYNSVHKLHHEFTSPVAVAGLYCHPVEQVLNLTGVLLGPLIVAADVRFTAVWVCLSSLASVFAHSGYDWAWFSARDHDLHHERHGKVNYGLAGLMDGLCGTAA